MSARPLPPMGVAAARGDIDALTALLAEGIHIDATTRTQPRTCLMEACKGNSDRAVDFLIAKRFCRAAAARIAARSHVHSCGAANLSQHGRAWAVAAGPTTAVVAGPVQPPISALCAVTWTHAGIRASCAECDDATISGGQG